MASTVHAVIVTTLDHEAAKQQRLLYSYTNVACVSIVFLKLPIMLWSNALDSCLLCSKHQLLAMLHKFNISFLLTYLTYKIFYVYEHQSF